MPLISANFVRYKPTAADIFLCIKVINVTILQKCLAVSFIDTPSKFFIYEHIWNNIIH